MRYFPSSSHFFQLVQLRQTIWSLLISMASTLLLMTYSQERFTYFLNPIILLKILIALCSARFFGMIINQTADALFDKYNPRTSRRLIAAGRISKKQSLFLAIILSISFIGTSFSISSTAGISSIILTPLIATYSYTKRFTSLCHFYIGLLLGLIPICVAIAYNITIPYWSIILCIGITSIVSASDIVYSMQDIKVDRSLNLYSIPSRYGVNFALYLTGGLYFIATSSLLLLVYSLKMPFLFQLPSIYFLVTTFSSYQQLKKNPLKNNLQIFSSINRLYCLVLLVISTGYVLWVAI